jgi:hypothetical protein
MTQDEIVEMAIKSHLVMSDYDHPTLAAFAKLVAEKEREACANVCEAQEDDGGEWDIQQQCANAIRAREQA